MKFNGQDWMNLIQLNIMNTNVSKNPLEKNTVDLIVKKRHIRKTNFGVKLLLLL